MEIGRFIKMATNRGARLVAKLHAVTLIRSGIGRPYWEKRTLDALGLSKLHQTTVHKNTPSINGMLRSVKDLVLVRPVVVRNDVERSACGEANLSGNGHFFVQDDSLLCLGVDGTNPRHRRRRKSARLWAKKKK